VNAIGKERKEFAHFRQTFLKISEAEVKGGIFFFPQITQLFEDRDFSTKLILQKKSLEGI